jgi:hypothetical protein
MSDVQIAVVDQQDTQIVLAVPGVQGATGSEIPTGGTADQVLRKSSSTNYDTNWSQVTSAMIADGTIVNADINASAAIAGTKISPDFGSQTVQTTGIFSAAGGSAAAPSIAFTGDTNTGIYSPGADQVAISTGGSGRLFVDASGRVGVAAASPINTLEVQGGPTANLFAVKASSGGDCLAVTARSAGGGGIVSALNNDQGDYAPLELNSDFIYFRTRTGVGTVAERLRITSAGLVGVGTSAPVAKIHSVETSAAEGLRVDGDGGGFALVVNGGTSYATKARQVSIGSSYFSNTPPADGLIVQGSVGVGTTSPATTLAVNGNIGSTDRGTSFGYTLPDWRIYNSSSGNALVIDNYTTEALRVDSSNRLLVGTSSSSAEAKFIVQGGTTGAGGAVNIQRGATTASAGSTIGFINFTNSSNNVGATVIAEGDGTWTAGTSHPTRLVFSTTADGASSPTERMRIDSAGVTKFTNGNGTFLELLNTGGYSGFHAVDGTAYTIGQNSNVRSLRIGSGSGWLTTGVELAAGGTSWGTYSDVRLKTDIVELTGCLDTIKDIRCVSYRLTDVDESDSKKRLGVIAQDLVGKYDEAVNASKRSDDDETEYLSVQYTDLVPVLIKALQEATFKIETLEAKVAALETA